MFLCPFPLYSNESSIFLFFSKSYLSLNLNSGFLTSSTILQIELIMCLIHTLCSIPEVWQSNAHIRTKPGKYIFIPVFWNPWNMEEIKPHLIGCKLSSHPKVLKFKGPQIVFGNQGFRNMFIPGKQYTRTGEPLKTTQKKNLDTLM